MTRWRGAVSNIIKFLCLYFLEIHSQMARLIAAGIVGHTPAVNYLKTCLMSVKPLKEKRHLFCVKVLMLAQVSQL